MTDLLLCLGSNHGSGAWNMTSCRAAASFEELSSRQDPPLRLFRILVCRGNGFVRPNHQCRAICENDFRMPLHDRYGTGKGAWREQVIGAKYEEIVGGRPIDAFIERGQMSEIAAMRDDLDSPVRSGELARHLQGIVGRSIVDDNKPQVADVLGQDAGRTVPQEVPILVAWDDDIDAGHRASRGVSILPPVASGYVRPSAAMPQQASTASPRL